ncbi:oligopeptide transport system permease protein [Metamycoplasma subdolum]|uniref:Oligopeptide transport system permease protein n=1 Tax=Metamycoplasma subdolum TaxID=92407 RepID=A0A3M0A1S8_9BACT|nr:ABC transporter permease [Metamycoplasma subdolum]RMA78607.1 oligopeptide transport system permease protein [Metamycoplasma subdolum]WPB50258.1 ABC transporter permease [Metamycoplasma subdolum]
MTRYILQRLGFAALTLLIISMLSYVLTASFGPNAYEILADEQWAKPGIKPAGSYEDFVKILEIKHGLRYGEISLDETKVIVDNGPIPAIVRYFRYIGNFLKGDYGFVINPKNNPDPVNYDTMPKLFFVPLKYSLMVTFPAFVLSSITGVTLGIFAGYKRGKLFDSAINVFVMIFIALPSFIIAPIAISISTKLGILPVVPEMDGSQPFGVVFAALLPPILVITISSLASYTIYARNQVITVLTSNYILIAKTKGLSHIQIFFKYVFRNISIPIFAIVFPSFIGLLSGGIIIERFWNIKGTSQVIAFSFPNGEINIVMFSIQFFTFVSLLVELFVDVMYVVLDPRIKYGKTNKRNYIWFIKAFFIRRKLAKERFAKMANENQKNEQILNGVK